MAKFRERQPESLEKDSMKEAFKNSVDKQDEIQKANIAPYKLLICHIFTILDFTHHSKAHYLLYAVFSSLMKSSQNFLFSYLHSFHLQFVYPEACHTNFGFDENSAFNSMLYYK